MKYPFDMRIQLKTSGVLLIVGVLLATTCADRSSDGNEGAFAGSDATANYRDDANEPDATDGENRTEIKTDCTLLCEKILGCQKNFPRQSACQWVLDGNETYCQSACETDLTDNAVQRDCVHCLAENLSCGGTAPVRPCDADCSPTSYVTGADHEGVPSYAFTTYYCDDPVALVQVPVNK